MFPNLLPLGVKTPLQIRLATAAIPNTLTQLAFHKLAFHGETLTWLDDGQPQSAQLKP